MKAADRLPLGKKNLQSPRRSTFTHNRYVSCPQLQIYGRLLQTRHTEKEHQGHWLPTVIKIERGSCRNRKATLGPVLLETLVVGWPLTALGFLSLTCTLRKFSVPLPVDRKEASSGVTDLGPVSASATPHFPILKMRGKMNPTSKLLRGLNGIMPMRDTQNFKCSNVDESVTGKYFGDMLCEHRI